MRFHDEVRPTKPIPTGGRRPAKKQVDQAVALIEALATDWDPASYRDCYRERLKRVVEASASGARSKFPSPSRNRSPYRT